MDGQHGHLPVVAFFQLGLNLWCCALEETHEILEGCQGCKAALLHLGSSVQNGVERWLFKKFGYRRSRVHCQQQRLQVLGEILLVLNGQRINVSDVQSIDSPLPFLPPLPGIREMNTREQAVN